MNRFSRIRHHVDMKDVRQRHLEEVAAKKLEEKIKFIKIREPGGTKNSEIIRNIILNKKSTFKKKTDLLLYLAARNENYENLKNH